MTPATLTPRARAELANRVARARLHTKPPTPPKQTRNERDLERTNRTLERANRDLILTVDHLNVLLRDSRNHLAAAETERDQALANARRYKRYAEAKGYAGWLAAEAQIVQLKQRIRELEDKS